MENTFIQMLYPIHPKLVHFPIALMVSAMGMQALGVFFKKDPWCKGAWLMKESLQASVQHARWTSGLRTHKKSRKIL